jgi:tRNA-2-methylthio-N6-dimethylallyladenosine synthase
MNVADSEIVASILRNYGYSLTSDIGNSDIILINTCSVRQNAEIRVHGRLDVIKQIKKNRKNLIVGLIGCMAQRIKEELHEEVQIIDIIAGPDSYRDLPFLIEKAKTGMKAINVDLSEFETYSEILPFRYKTNNISAFIPIMRGCNNLCAYCVVPGTRGVERSSNPEMIILEISKLIEEGYKEIVLIGQNVNSYKWQYDDGSEITFSGLLEKVASEFSQIRFRFSTSHPKDMNDDVLIAMAKHKNICKCIHLPVQSGNSRILEMMNRGYTREWYLSRIDAIRKILPDCAVTTDIITGFCSETEEEHSDTLSLMEYCQFDFAFMFKYNERPGTYAMITYEDDVPEKVKTRRLTEIINLQNRLSEETKNADINKVYEVLVEGYSKKSKDFLSGRNSQNKVVVFPAGDVKKGDFVNVLIKSCTSATLIGEKI